MANVSRKLPNITSNKDYLRTETAHVRNDSEICASKIYEQLPSNCVLMFKFKIIHDKLLMLFRAKYEQRLRRVLGDSHQGRLKKLSKMMRNNTSHDEDDEDNIDSRFGTKSESKVGKYNYSQTLRKELSLNEWILE